LNEIIGTTGLLLLLSAFVLNLLKRLGTDSVTYYILNVVGCVLLSYYAIVINSIPFLILESVWGLFAIFKLITILLKKNQYASQKLKRK